jgi:transcription initiation factor TFIIIB Brf1 subunit/transcription initiation factor TFIIB/Mn-dependent DtxR family transcriptional regulator
MIEDDINSNRCRFCRSSFSVEILKKIEDDRNDVYCENCGDLIKRVQNKYNFNPTEIIEKISNTNTNDTPNKPQKELESNPDALHYPIGRIFYDKAFPLIFKSNFIIVFSRLTYFHALHLESKGQIELGSLEVPENAINNLYMSIRHVQNMRIKAEFLNNLHEISKEEFERNLKKLQAKIQSSRQYREDFIISSRWLIKRVLTIVSEKKPNDQLTKFERTILTNIENLVNGNNYLITNKETDLLVLDKIKEAVKKFEEKKLPYDVFLNSNVPNFLSLKKNGIYDKLITQFKMTKRRALILKKGFIFSESFKKWLLYKHPNYSEKIKKINENFEILQYIVYELIEESKKPINKRKFIKEIAMSIGVSSSTITNFGKKLGELGIIDYNSKFSIKTTILKENRFFSRDLGLIDHEAMNNILTIYFKKVWNAKFYAEPYIFKPISLEHPDGLITLRLMSKNFQDFFNSTFYRIFPDLMSFKEYDYILIDYTSLISEENVKTKLNKYFPPNNTLLLIIGFSLDKNNMEFQDFSFLPFNVKVISPSFLAKLIQLNLLNNNNFQIIFDKIITAINENDFEKLIKIRERTKTKLNKTETLIIDLQTSNLSSIFNSATNKSSVFRQKNVENIKSGIDELSKKFKLNSEIEILANDIIDNLYDSKEISLSYDYTGYVAASIYASSKFLLNKISYEDLTAFLKITSTPLTNRLNDIKNNPKLIFDLLIHALIKKILKLLSISDDNIKKKILEIIKIFYKNYLSSIDKVIAFCITIIYLVVNRFDKKLSQRKICEILNFNNRNGITWILEDLTKLKEISLNFGIDCENIKNNRITDELIELLMEKGALTTKQVIQEMGFDCRRHLKKLLNDKIIEKELKFIGRTKTAFWKLPNININMNLFDPRRERVINMLVNHQFLTTSEISVYLDEDTKTVYKYLCKLEEKELIKKNVKREGKTFRAYWKLA